MRCDDKWRETRARDERESEGASGRARTRTKEMCCRSDIHPSATLEKSSCFVWFAYATLELGRQLWSCVTNSEVVLPTLLFHLFHPLAFDVKNGLSTAHKIKFQLLKTTYINFHHLHPSSCSTTKKWLISLMPKLAHTYSELTVITMSARWVALSLFEHFKFTLAMTMKCCSSIG